MKCAEYDDIILFFKDAEQTIIDVKSSRQNLSQPAIRQFLSQPAVRQNIA
jgi:hypothetical protein